MEHANTYDKGIDFVHYWDGTKLYSKINVYDIAMASKNILACGIVAESIHDIDTINSEIAYDVDPYIKMSAWWIELLKMCKSDFIHFGDCVKQSITCTLCMCEDMYMFGESEMNYFCELVQKYDMFDNYDIAILYMTVKQLEEEYWNGFKQLCDEHFKNKENKGLPEHEKCPEIEDLMNQFMQMPMEEQQAKYNRMKKVREYIKSPYKIEGIPWWQ